MANAEEAADHLKRLRDAFAEAEAEIKRTEFLTDEAVIPAVNQLRYAGYHMSRSLVSVGGYDDRHIEKATNHCRRALIDAIEVQIIVYSANFRLFQKEFGSTVIVDLFPEYLNIESRVGEAMEFLTTNSLHEPPNIQNSGDDVDNIDWCISNDDLSDTRDHIASLREADQKLSAIRPELNKRKTSERRRVLYAIWGLIVTIVGAAITAVTLFS